MRASPYRLARALFVLPLVALAADEEIPVPWPHGGPPSPGELDAMVDGATELATRERSEEFLEAAERGEDREHITVFQDDVDLGVYDLDALFQRGDSLFGHEFRAEDGLSASGLRRVHTASRGGLDTYSCAGCHSVGGPDGAGAETANAHTRGDGDRFSTATARNPPALLGLGFVQALAAEMTAELHAARDSALARAAADGVPVEAALATNEVSFGALVAHPDGRVDTSLVEGVDPDLVVRPFGWKGEIATLRRFVEEAARVHFGVQSHVLALRHRDRPDPEQLGDGPDWWDPDGDGIARELEEGTLTATAVYLALLESPVILPPRDPVLLERWSRGAARFESIGCDSCHRSEVALNYVYWMEASDTTGGDPVVVNLTADGETPRGTALVRLFADFKRHDMGPELAEPNAATDASTFLTRPLWGLAETAPYLHDGRAATIPDAIEAHGGEAADARDAFAALDEDDQIDLHVFLLSLTREPKPRVAR